MAGDPTTAAPVIRIVGRYAIRDPIAAGAMATVHFGSLLGQVGFSRTVALKRLHPKYATDPKFVAMFLDEARHAARLRHPNVVPIIDVVSADGELFLVMEYIHGESLVALTRATRGNGIPPHIACAIMANVLHGLHAAHEATDEEGVPLGLVHRDVSPANILVGADGIARVLDFGVAKATGSLDAKAEDTLHGKIAYMPPEQLRGAVTRQSDVYAASVVLWETLTGRRLYTAEDNRALVQKIMKQEVQPPSSLAPDVPPEIDAVVLCGLERDAQQRFPDARAMALAIERHAFATPSTVGDWVKETARESLEQRAATMAAIERTFASDTVISPSLPPQSRPDPSEEPTVAYTPGPQPKAPQPSEPSEEKKQQKKELTPRQKLILGSAFTLTLGVVVLWLSISPSTARRRTPEDRAQPELTVSVVEPPPTAPAASEVDLEVAPASSASVIPSTTTSPRPRAGGRRGPHPDSKGIDFGVIDSRR
jgi:serine/threonine-protein kinase